MSRGRVLVVDDDPESCAMLEETLTHRGFEVTWSTKAEEALDKFLHERRFDVVLTDLRLGRHNGVHLCSKILAAEPGFPVVVITGYGSISTAVEAMRAGAYDFITKPFDIELVAMALDRAVRHWELQREVQAIRNSTEAQFENMLGTSPLMQRVFDTIARAALSDAPVLISGESGTGKELGARALHRRSARAEEPFLAVHCAALPEPLLESALFGRATSGTRDARDQDGVLIQAGRGTVFLDEIAEMPLPMQVKLQEALQTRAVRPSGGNEDIPFEARIVAATHRDLEAEVAAGRFRQDLFFRIHVIELILPPLRLRGSDVLALAEAFVRRFRQRADKPELKLSAAVAERLLAYEWPGNVRELENSIERAVALARANEILLEDLPERVRRSGSSSVLIAADAPDELVTLEEMERRYVLRVMRAVGNSKKLAAQVLGLDRSTLYRKLERYEGT